jgi:hypothetical protein
VPGSSIFSCERRAVVTQVGEKERTEDRVCACMCVHVLFSISLCSNPPLFICFILISVPNFFFFCATVFREVCGSVCEYACATRRFTCTIYYHLYTNSPLLYFLFCFLFLVVWIHHRAHG